MWREQMQTSNRQVARDRFLLPRQAHLAREGTQDPSLTKEINLEGLREHHLEPNISTQRLGFGERVEPNMLGIVVLNHPLKGFPGKRKPAKHIVLDHYLSSRVEQAPQPRERL